MVLSRKIDIKLCQKNTITYIYWYCNNFDTVLYQFFETGTSDRTLIGLDQLLKFLGFSLYHLSFFLYSPFKFYFQLWFSL